MEINHNRHSVGGSNYHLQFTPKYRRQVFRVEQVKKLTEALIRRKAHELGVQVEAIEFGPDHAHTFVTGCRRYSVSELANYLKGYSSRYVREKLSEDIRPYLWGDAFWSEGYFYESIGRVTADTVKFYIERQQGKHWNEAKLDPLAWKQTKPSQTTLETFCTYQPC